MIIHNSNSESPPQKWSSTTPYSSDHVSSLILTRGTADQSHASSRERQVLSNAIANLYKTTNATQQTNNFHCKYNMEILSYQLFCCLMMRKRLMHIIQKQSLPPALRYWFNLLVINYSTHTMWYHKIPYSYLSDTYMQICCLFWWCWWHQWWKKGQLGSEVIFVILLALTSVHTIV